MDNTPVPPAGRSSQQSGAATEGQRFELPVLSEREMSERREGVLTLGILIATADM